MPDVTPPVAPFTSNDWLSLRAPGDALPTPATWLRAVASAGPDIVWRMYGGTEQPLSRMPADHTGWFLERRARLSEHDSGVFFAHAGVNADGVSVTVKCKGADRCFTADGWSAHLDAT